MHFVLVHGAYHGTWCWDSVRAELERFVYQDCDPQTAKHAARRLRRQHWRVTQEVTPLSRRPAVRSAYILCAGDRVVSSPYSPRAATELLGVEPVEMPGGHSQFLSRPRDLAHVLVQVASASGETAHG